uniref:Uncharacterized protein AlNc14C23G2354 n=1 Tax=Albugo laibachii Nc14 TaxID=890382 RepID=F0W655_9STRA|nr:conserved hypothetical protein [Albugo laibachii Nc14]|eukprot:CCA16597.1 conserved hypothetical protein [Albugo laibachii Nc14]
MGAYISIENDTPDTWKCKVTSDDVSIKVGVIVAAATSLLGAIISVFAKTWPFILSENLVVAGMNQPKLLVLGKLTEIGGNTLSVFGTGSSLGMLVVRTLEEEYASQGYVTLVPGSHHSWGKMPPLFWRQAICVRTFELNGTVVRTETVRMRPIFSRRPGRWSKNESIGHWMEKKGTKTQDVVIVVADHPHAEDNKKVHGNVTITAAQIEAILAELKKNNQTNFTVNGDTNG